MRASKGNGRKGGARGAQGFCPTPTSSCFFMPLLRAQVTVSRHAMVRLGHGDQSTAIQCAAFQPWPTSFAACKQLLRGNAPEVCLARMCGPYPHVRSACVPSMCAIHVCHPYVHPCLPSICAIHVCRPSVPSMCFIV